MDTSTFQLGKYLSVSQIILFFSLSLSLQGDKNKQKVN